MTLEPVDPAILRSRLREGVVVFRFRKKDGTLRDAIGTTRLENIPTGAHPKGVKTSSDKQICFFDFEKLDWRSVSTDSEIFI